MSAISGVACCLANSFSASAKGCGRPAKPTLLGPLRNWKYARNFRSNRVKNAIASREQTSVLRICRRRPHIGSAGVVPISRV